MKANDLIDALNAGKTPADIFDDLAAAEHRKGLEFKERAGTYDKRSPQQRVLTASSERAFAAAAAYVTAATVVRAHTNWKKDQP